MKLKAFNLIAADNKYKLFTAEETCQQQQQRLLAAQQAIKAKFSQSKINK